MKKTILPIVLGCLITLTACNSNKQAEPTKIVNPASVYCEEQNGTLETRTDKQDNQISYCIFKDGSECEEWSYYKKECTPSKPTNEVILGSNCGTVTPGQEHKCCQERMKNELHTACTGKWKYKKNKCAYICDEEKIN